jgi:hypothetical protein
LTVAAQKSRKEIPWTHEIHDNARRIDQPLFRLPAVWGMMRTRHDGQGFRQCPAVGEQAVRQTVFWFVILALVGLINIGSRVEI